MIYNNLIYFLVVILILTTNTAPDHPQLSAPLAITAFLAKAGLFQWLLRKIFEPSKINSPTSYTSAERQGSILAILFLSIDVYLLDCQYYFSMIPGASKLPVIISLSGLILFSVYLSMMWAAASRTYRGIFGSGKDPGIFVKTNLKTNLPIILPWLAISLFADLLQLSSVPFIKSILSSAWGEPLVFLAFFLCLAVLFPVIVTRMWGCTPLPPGAARQSLEQFCQDHDIGYADIMLWPLFEGQALTAGVMGITKRFRYLLVTPALLATLTPEEIEAVMAHEIGHVKKKHLQLYLVLFLGFGMVAQLSTYPILYLLTSSDLFYQAIHLANKRPGNALAAVSTIPMFVLMIVYFRYIMGFFMRNFERQADLFALKTMKTSAPLVRVFEKIAWLSGDIRDQPSWHHFGIGQRVDFLQKSEKSPALIKRHDRKVYTALAVYLLILTISALGLWKMPDDILEGAPREKFAEAVIHQKISEDPQNYTWYQLLGDLQYSRKMFKEAANAYQQALELGPERPEALNNLAWLLLTASDSAVKDPQKALHLAKKAVALYPKAHILDTLALAYWQNGFVELAILSEKRAIAQGSRNRAYYLQQLEKFTSGEGQKTF